MTPGSAPDPAANEERGTGTVLQAVGGVYRVLPDPPGDRIVEAFLRGRLKHGARRGDRAVAGDRVVLSREGETWTVEELLPRRSALIRAAPGGRSPKVVAANLDRVIVVVSADQPSLRREQVDRFLALAEACRLPAVLVVNKVELPSVEEMVEEVLGLYRKIGYPVLATSAVTGRGLEGVAGLLRDGTSAVVGPSGVGKSSLLNAVEPGLDLRVGAVSARKGSGRHTTVAARLILLPGGGRVVDTPGFTDVSLWGVERGRVPDTFPEIRALAPGCRFRGCVHLQEPDCAVRAAVAAGEVDSGRYESYVALHEGGERSPPASPRPRS